MSTSHPLRFGLLGAGHIAGKMGKTLAFLAKEGCVETYAVASRDLAKSEKLRAEHGFAKAFGSYEEMLADGNVDAVYVATPNSLHASQVKMCLAAGKHVLCEKPFTLKTSEAAELFAEAKSRGLFLMEALWTRFMPAVGLIRDVIASGEIGEPRFLNGIFALDLAWKDRVTDPKLGGGALLDLGIYPINFADMFFGLAGAEVSSAAVLSPEGVDDQSVITLKYPDGRMASLSTSMTAAYGTTSRIAGTKGCIDMPMLTTCQEFTVKVGRDGAERKVACPFDCNGYEYEVRAMAEAIRQGRTECNEMPPSKTLEITAFMEKLRAGWGCAV